MGTAEAAGEPVHPPAPSYEYKLFMSYSTDPDYRLVRSTESFIESFHKTRLARADIILRALKVCVDGSDFTLQSARRPPSQLTDEVNEKIAQYLQTSEYLLVFCSRKASESPYVGFEVDWFLKNRGPNAVLLAVTEGEDPGRKPDEIFPAAVIAAGLHRKVWYDFRGQSPRAHRWQKVRDFTAERVRLAADLNCVPAGEILPLWYQQERQRQRRRLSIAGVVIALLCVLTAYAFWKRYVAIENSRIAKARELAANAMDQRDQDPELAILLAREGLRRRPDENTASLALRNGVLASRVRARFDHDWPVTAVAFNPAGTLLAVGSVAGAPAPSPERHAHLRLWDTSTGQLAADPLPQRKDVTALAFDPTGTRLVTSSTDGRLRVWAQVAGVWRQTRRFAANKSGVRDVRFDARGQLLVTAGADAAVRIWDVETATQVDQPLMHEGVDEHDQPVLSTVASADISPDGRFVATGAQDGFVRMWDRASHGVRWKQPMGSPITSVRFSADGTKVITAAGYKAQVWDAATGEGQAHFAHEAIVRSTSLNPDATRAVTACEDGSAWLWDTATWAPIAPRLRGHSKTVTQAVFRSDGNLVATASEDATVRLWDVRPTHNVQTVKHGSAVSSIAISRSGRLIASGDKEWLARLWNAQAGETEVRTLVAPGYGTTLLSEVAVLAFDRDDRRLFTGSGNGFGRLWTVSDGKPVGDLLEHEGNIVDAAFGCGDDTLATASGHRAYLWRVGGVAAEPILLNHSAPVLGVTFACNTAALVTASSTELREWDPASGQPTSRSVRLEQPASRVEFGQGRRFFATVSDVSAVVWDSTTMAQVAPATVVPQAIEIIALNADGERLVTTSGGTAQLWDAISGTQLGAPFEFRSAVSAATFSSGGRLVVFGTKGGGMYVYDTRTRAPVIALTERKQAVDILAFDSADGFLVSASADGAVRILPRPMFAPADELLGQWVPQRLKRTLSRDEKRTFLYEQNDR